MKLSSFTETFINVCTIHHYCLFHNLPASFSPVLTITSNTQHFMSIGIEILCPLSKDFDEKAGLDRMQKRYMMHEPEGFLAGMNINDYPF